MYNKYGIKYKVNIRLIMFALTEYVEKCAANRQENVTIVLSPKMA